jgi:hypothetical protein
LIIIIIVFAIAIGLGKKVQAANWYDYDWQYRTAITIYNTKVDDDLTDFPVLISSTNTDWADTNNGGHVGQADGGDFVFTASDNTTTLSYQIETYNNTTGQLIAWVKVNSLANLTDTVINLYYGNAGCADQQNATSVWSNGNAGVWHFPNGSTLSAADSTSNNNNGTINNSSAVVGKIYGAAKFNHSTGSFINVPDSSTIKITGAVTVSSWVYLDETNFSGYTGLIKKGANADTPNNYLIQGIDGTKRFQLTYSHSSNANDSLNSVGSIKEKDWSYISGIIDTTNGTMKIYIDGVLDNSKVISNEPMLTSTNALWIGKRPDNGHNGYMDETRISNTARSTGWISTEYKNQNSPSTFYSLATTEQGDLTPPTNPAIFNGYNTSGKTASLTTDNWYNYSAPYFEFSGASDPESGVKGYYVYWGTDNNADPYAEGVYQAHVGVAGATQTYTVSSSLITEQTYYLRLITENNATANNLSGVETLFTYKYDPTAPSSPEYINTSPVGCSTESTFTFTWPVASDTGGSGIKYYEYKNGSIGNIENTTELTKDVNPYQEGDNIFYVRTKDNAGNISSWQTAIYCSASVSQIIDGPTATAGPASITVSWQSNKDTTGFIEVRDGNSYREPQGHRDYKQIHAVTVGGLRSERNYQYRIIWQDEDKNESESQWYSTNTTTSPQIQNLDTNIVSPTKAILTWETNYSSTSKLEYGLTSYTTPVNFNNLANGFSYTLDNLKAGSLYKFRIIATTKDGFDYTIGAELQVPPLPEITGLSFTKKSDEATPAVIVEWDSNVEITSSVFYGPNGQAKKEKSTTEKKKNHQVIISQLEDSSTYEFYTTGIDQYGNTAQSNKYSYVTPADSRAPTISNIVIETSNVGYDKTDKSQVIISWKTDEPATSTVQYGEGISGTDYTSSTTEDKLMTTDHLIIISDLIPGTPYHFRVLSKDKGENIARSEDNTIISGEVNRSVLQIILNVFRKTFGWLDRIF